MIPNEKCVSGLRAPLHQSCVHVYFDADRADSDLDDRIRLGDIRLRDGHVD